MKFVLFLLFLSASNAYALDDVYTFFPYANYDSTYNWSYGLTFEKDSELFSNESYSIDAELAKDSQTHIKTKYQNSLGNHWIELARVEYSSFADPFYDKISIDAQDPSFFIKEKSIYLQNTLYYELSSTLYLGPYIDFHHRHEFLSSFFPNENTFAVGGKFLFDNRDSKLNPHEGLKIEVSSKYIDSHLNQTTRESSFMQIRSDIRKYTPIEGTVLASRLALGESFGRVNYSYLYHLGGIDLLRGYQEQRYLGKQFMALQLEERINLYKEYVAATVSGEAGNVSNNFVDQMKYCYGVGLRIAMPPDWQNMLVLNYAKGLHQDNIIMELSENF